MTDFGRKRSNFAFTGSLFLFVLLITSAPLCGQDTASPGGTASGDIIIPGSEPFSLDAWSAGYCISILKNSRYLEKNGDSGKYRIIEVDTVWSWFLEYDETSPEGHRKRYDIIVNGNRLDWDNSYIEYGGEMLNLRLLFLYRNQYPPGELEGYRENPGL